MHLVCILACKWWVYERTHQGTLGLKWLPAGDAEPATGLNLEHAKLAEILRSKTEFTKLEWEDFGIKDLRIDHVIKSGDKYFQPAEGKSMTCGNCVCVCVRARVFVCVCKQTCTHIYQIINTSYYTHTHMT
jgi:hypothetical protein